MVGTDAWYGTRTGVSERFPSAHPMATSACGTDRRAGFVAEEVEQTCVVRAAQMCFVLRLRCWKEGFMNMLNRNFMRLLMMEVFSRVCSGVLWG